MSKTVFVTTYEVTGETGLEVAREHFDAIRVATNECWDEIRKLGAVGFRPGFRGAVRSLFFEGKDAPEGYRRIGSDNGNVECVPHKGRAIGKAAEKAIADLPAIPSENDLGRLLGWDNDYGVTNGSSVFHSTTTRLLKPTERIFVRIPRQEDDGYVPHPSFAEVTEGEFLRAIEAHNAFAREARSTEAA